MTRQSLTLPLATIFSLVVLIMSVQVAHAASVSWSGGDNVLLANSILPNYPSLGDGWYIPLINPSVVVQYSADAQDEAGQSVCRASIPVGTSFTVRFPDLTPEDVQWFVTGGAWDTPYGAWAKDAAISEVACRPGDQVSSFRTEMWGRIQLFTPFVANPPQRSLTVLNGLISCDMSELTTTGIAHCTANAIGKETLHFNFSDTYGKFYFRAKVHAGLDRNGKSVITITRPTNTPPADPRNPVPSACVGYLPSSYYHNESNTGKGYLELFSFGDYEPMVQPQGTYAPARQYGIDLYADGAVISPQVTTSNFLSALSQSSPYQFNIPAQTITCGIEVTPARPAPVKPTVLGGACIVGQALTIQFSSTDPGGHQLRYGIDWDADASIDQWAPPSGYVPSGSEQSAKRTFAIPGEKHVAVMVENDQGVRSEWTHNSFDCAESLPSPQQCAIGYEYMNGACVFVSCPVGYVKQGNACIFQGCPVGYTLQNGVCMWTGCPAGFFQQGSQCVLENQCVSLPYCQGQDLYNGCTHERIQVCQYGCANGACKGVPSPIAALSASPAIVIKGKTTKLSWNSANTESCTVTGGNGDSFSALTVANHVSGPINSTTVFTLHCNGYDGSSPAYVEKKVTVTVRPDYEEQ